MPVGDRMKDLREYHGLSQRDLAELAGVHKTTISKLEDGTTPRIHVTTAAALSEALYVPITELFQDCEVTTQGRQCHTPNYSYEKKGVSQGIQANCPKCHTALTPSGLCGWCG